ncbi:hypothetical protein ACJRO7_016438 [Eucalyptus globulus]|uniref:Uncharacterized protein n=1 Tax=Eucalyptus globulus TaxID=34317 RepID=A0ABD3L736_EUCGL
MAEKLCKFFESRDGEVLLPQGWALIKLFLDVAFYAKDPESGGLLDDEVMVGQKLISIRLDIDEVRCHRGCAIKDAVHPHLIDMGVPEDLQADILDKIASLPLLRNWSKTARVPSIMVDVVVQTGAEDYEPETDASEGPGNIDLLPETVTPRAEAEVRCPVCWEEREKGRA